MKKFLFSLLLFFSFGVSAATYTIQGLKHTYADTYVSGCNLLSGDVINLSAGNTYSGPCIGGTWTYGGQNYTAHYIATCGYKNRNLCAFDQNKGRYAEVASITYGGGCASPKEWIGGVCREAPPPSCPDGQSPDSEGECVCSSTGKKPNALGVCEDYCNSVEWFSKRDSAFAACNAKGGNFTESCVNETDNSLNCSIPDDNSGGGNDGGGNNGGDNGGDTSNPTDPTKPLDPDKGGDSSNSDLSSKLDALNDSQKATTNSLNSIIEKNDAHHSENKKLLEDANKKSDEQLKQDKEIADAQKAILDIIGNNTEGTNTRLDALSGAINGQTGQLASAINGQTGQLASAINGQTGQLGTKLDELGNKLVEAIDGVGNSKGSVSGGCESNFVCSGYDIECYTAKQARDQACLLNQFVNGNGDGTTVDTFTNEISGHGDNTLTALKTYNDKNLDFTKLSTGEISLENATTLITESNGGLSFSESCPASHTVGVLTAKFTINYQPFCELALYVRAMLMLFASISSIIMFAKFS
ncbi:hypothetical protein FR271_22010 [Vibrio vulnificus]|nr:hypothetical protein [Vibrio vulnificus]EGR0093627.1 hypothetical protein [Vibrio vulnificus]